MRPVSASSLMDNEAPGPQASSNFAIPQKGRAARKVRKPCTQP
jgi:hypothetical protein